MCSIPQAAAVLLAFAAVTAGCWRSQDLPLDQPPGDSDSASDLDTDVDSDTDSDSDSDTDSDSDSDGDSDTVPDPCVFRVDVSSEPGGNGLTWEDAFDMVRQGLEAAEASLSESDTCQVWVAAGTYYIYEDNHYDTVDLRPFVELYGGFAGDETALDERDPEVNVTILDGHSGPGPTVRVYHVVTGANDALIDGFTITGGWANGELIDGRGGGMLNQNASPTVVNCRFVNNFTCEEYECVGGGMHNAFSSPEVIDCEFVSNTAGIGGGMGNHASHPVVTGCLFSDNVTPTGSGGGMHNAAGGPTIIDCAFELNTAALNGGAVVNHATTAEFADCTFDTNSTENNAGGAMFNYELSEVTVDGCSFHNNSAATNGGAIASIGAETVAVTGSAFASNSAGESGGAIFAAGAEVAIHSSVLTANHAEGGVGGAICSGDEEELATDLEVVNCTFFDNSTGADVDAMGVSIAATLYNTATAINCIFSESEPGELYGALATAEYSLISSDYEGEGNLDADPLFVAPLLGDFTLSPGSPCIDAADGALAPEFDFDGNERVDDTDTPNTGVGPPWADMGAFEFQP